MEHIFKKIFGIVPVMFCLLAPLYGAADKIFLEKVDAAIRPYMTKHQIPGMALLLKEESRISEIIAYGESAKGSKIDLNAHSVLPIGTISETFIGALLARKLSLGKIKLSDPIQTYLPKPLQVPSLKNHTIEELAAHHCNLPEIPIDFFSQKGFKFGGLKRLLAHCKSKKSNGYSKLDYILLAEVLSNSMGLSFQQMVQKELFSHLGLQDTLFFLSKPQRSRLAKGNSEARSRLASQLMPALGLYSTPRDLLRWMESCLDSNDAAWGWEERSLFGEKYLFKESNLFGFNLRFYLSKKRGRGIAFLANLESSLKECEKELLPYIISLF